MNQNPEALAEQHAAEATRLIAEVDEHLAKRGRKMGLEQNGLAALANAHATLAVYHAGRVR
jgi:hypothetical protein